jgi:hypothetical protein
MNSFTDYLGQEVKEGDYVTFNQSGRDLEFGLVEKITPKQVRILYAVWDKHAVNQRKDHRTVVKVTAETSTVRARKAKLHQAIMAKVAKEFTTS